MRALSLLILLAACSTQKLYVYRGVAMTIPYEITTTQSDAQRTIDATFEHINMTFNRYNPDSEISRINRESGPFEISNDLRALILLTDRLVKITSGRFDPTMLPVQRLDTLATGRERPYVGWDKIHLSGNTLTKDDPRVEIDLGGIAKGYAVDLIAQKLGPNCLVDWGGEIVASGEHPEGRPWQVALQLDPSTTIPLKNQAIATSGNYLQQIEIDEETYTHIIDPKTLYPLKLGEVTAVSVLAPTCAYADGLATAAMLFPTANEVKKWAKTIPLATFWIISKEAIQQETPQQ